jgi:hypothetical protein
MPRCRKGRSFAGFLELTVFFRLRRHAGVVLMPDIDPRQKTPAGVIADDYGIGAGSFASVCEVRKARTGHGADRVTLSATFP